MKNLIGNELKPTEFQRRIIDRVKNKNALVVMPTNSGKTLIAYTWANILSDDFRKIIFTAPIKALSNERYRELKKEGLDVGLITGDVKWNPRAKVLCMTQEIYYQHYYKVPSYVVIDEFHYIFNNEDRARCYTESITNTSRKTDMLLMSATCSKPAEIKKYVEGLTDRKFCLATSKERLVPLEVNRRGVKLSKVRDALVFCFSRKAIRTLINELYGCRKRISDKKIRKISDLASEYRVNFFPEWEIGVSKYHGKLLPKEKMFIEYLYRNGFVDTVIGTDSLALGVNLPAKYAVIAQVYKPGIGYLRPSEFHQLTGRAGRFGQHEVGIATWLRESPVEDCYTDLESEFNRLVDSELEDVEIRVGVDYQALILGRFVEDEVALCSKYAFPKSDLGYYNRLVTEADAKIKANLAYVLERYGQQFHDQYRKLLVMSYLPEWDLERNLRTAELVTSEYFRTGSIYLRELLPVLNAEFGVESSCAGEYLHELLLYNKWVRSVSKFDSARFFDLNYVSELVDEIDYTVFRPDLSIE
jgi:superfamily II RNA helicase